MKRSIGVVLALCMAGAVGYLGYKTVTTDGPGEVAQAYIEAMQERDIDALVAINHRPQKQANIINRAPESEQEGLLKNMYDGYRQSLEAIAPGDNTTVTWAEKYYFVPGMEYRIVRVEEVKSPGTPSSDYRFRNFAGVIIAVSYATSGNSPEYHGRRIREATLKIDMVRSRDVVKGIQGKPVKEGWLFKWITIDDASVVYWNSKTQPALL